MVNKITGPIFIPFDQKEIIAQLNSEKHRNLLGFVRRYGGLCELICNRILFDDFLGTGTDQRSLKKYVTIENVDTENIRNSHILESFSSFKKAIAILVEKYPCNVFSYLEQKKLLNTSSSEKNQKVVNREMLSEGLARLRVGEQIKVHIFNKSGINFTGHSMLIKKMSNTEFIFFDPDQGEFRDLSFSKLCDRIDFRLKYYNGTHIFLAFGQAFLNRLKTMDVAAS